MVHLIAEIKLKKLLKYCVSKKTCIANIPYLNFTQSAFCEQKIPYLTPSQYTSEQFRKCNEFFMFLTIC